MQILTTMLHKETQNNLHFQQFRLNYEGVEKYESSIEKPELILLNLSWIGVFKLLKQLIYSCYIKQARLLSRKLKIRI
jgi:hypothetical protein